MKLRRESLSSVLIGLIRASRWTLINTRTWTPHKLSCLLGFSRKTSDQPGVTQIFGPLRPLTLLFLPSTTCTWNVWNGPNSEPYWEPLARRCSWPFSQRTTSVTDGDIIFRSYLLLSGCHPIDLMRPVPILLGPGTSGHGMLARQMLSEPAKRLLDQSEDTKNTWLTHTDQLTVSNRSDDTDVGNLVWLMNFFGFLLHGVTKQTYSLTRDTVLDTYKHPFKTDVKQLTQKSILSAFGLG